MIGYVTLGTNDLARGAAFYDALLGEMGAKRGWQTERYIAWNFSNGSMLCIITPYDQQPATVGNGMMVSLAAGSRRRPRRVNGATRRRIS